MIELFREQAKNEKILQSLHQARGDKIMRDNIEALNRLEQKRETSQLIHENEDEKYLSRFANQLEAHERKENERLFDEAIGRELGATKAERCRDERSRQLIWQNAPELRQLRQQVLLASVARDQAMQLAGRQALRELDRQESLAEQEKAAEQRHEDELEQKQKEVKEAVSKALYHADLDKQRLMQVAKEAEEVAQAKRERVLVDEIRKRIEEEDLEEERKKYKAQQELYRQAQELKRARDAQRLAEEATERRRLLKDDDYRRATELRQLEREERQKLETETRLRLQEELLKYLERMYAEKEKREALAVALAMEEREEHERVKSEEEEERKTKVQENAKAVNDMLMWVKKQQQDMIRREEEEFRKRNMAKLFEDEKLELMSLQKRKMKQIEHRKKVQEMIEENRRRAEKAQAREMAEHLERRELERERERIVEQERLSFLREHAPELLGYLPKGVLRSSQEADRLGEEFRRFYAPAPIESES